MALKVEMVPSEQPANKCGELVNGEKDKEVKRVRGCFGLSTPNCVQNFRLSLAAPERIPLTF
jgi:hypothetical protein